MNKKYIFICFYLLIMNFNVFSYEYSIEKYNAKMNLNLFSPWFKYETSNTKVGFYTEYSDVLEYKKISLLNLFNTHTDRFNFDYRYRSKGKGFFADIDIFLRDNREKFLGDYYYFKNKGFNISKNIKIYNNLYNNVSFFYKDTKSTNGFYNGVLRGIENKLYYIDYLYTEDSDFFKKRLKYYSVKMKYYNKLSYVDYALSFKNNIYENNKSILSLHLTSREIKNLDNYYLNILIRGIESESNIRGLSREIYSDNVQKISTDLYMILYKNFRFKFWHCYGLKIFADIYYDRAKYSLKNIERYFDTHGIIINFNSFFLGKIPLTLKFNMFKDENNKTDNYTSLDLLVYDF